MPGCIGIDYLLEVDPLANIKSAIKRVKVAEKKRMRNKPIRNRARNVVASVRKAVASGDVDGATQGLPAAFSALDKAARKGIIHPNNAARRKSRLAKALTKAREAASS